MEMGTGKTRVAVELINRNKPSLLLYITPFSTKDNVIAELEKWNVCCPYIVAGYESISSSDRIYMELLGKIKREENVFIVADESIFIKRGKTKRHQRAVQLRKYCKWALILNGTPIVKNEWDLFNQMEFLSEKIIPMDSFEFLERFFVEHRMWYNGRKRKYYTFFEPNRKFLTQLIAPYVFEAELDFEKNVFERTSWVDCDPEEYITRKKEILDAYLDDESIIVLFQELNRISACCPEKNEEVAGYISGKQVICYCRYLEEARQISEKCDCYVITGSTSQKERKRILSEFSSGSKPLVMTLGVGSYSLNLQFCNEIVYSSLSFDFGVMEQSKYRIKRVGQNSDITYTHILADFGINEMIFENLDKKKSLSDIVKELIEKERDNLKNYLKERL